MYDVCVCSCCWLLVWHDLPRDLMMISSLQLGRPSDMTAMTERGCSYMHDTVIAAQYMMGFHVIEELFA